MGSIVSMASGAHGFDESGHTLTGAYAACAAGQGKGFVGRYVSLTATEASTDLSSAEAVQITENGLAIAVFQHCYSRGNTNFANFATQGHTDASTAISHLNAMSAPSGLFVYCDIENFVYASDAAAYASAWAAQINASGTYKAAYYGPQNVLILITGPTLHGLWENVTNMGALTSPNISQSGSSALSCDASIPVDADLMVTSLGGFWGY